ncbi:7-cyano-7-deazaguanine synthase QueC [candidate division WOR-1 bacterium RIFOXYB2_FULL_42_35]|uniref:7-cyano-7-deazaguanine synthase n=1 Tax=candidate division WOR-1 bacterium RIFOXYC2_FULL_41_25 TaxID=1802586 RepID=A0A1F4TJ89_UNCSA|nr:MAG: 7-cyano-7-deazaguanine synthase QueC [candidate division WOR-1 bacterium RIFOXYA2_FULL_41_14]OGC21890.1 MAG: 7-cyano-7-deazaguanine synthase QueC [candidate division WOR-1 bacterium RIFOXYB2_FULL_42_35]OGC32754.1 MAG: 7-cyano-7-deazaguanine synthase QueC [candidate division WOR-1 bacterium RIFOXYC2_FULL_41_25]OGC42550.1 MAG: 7-cyano-7-deazaguanine synthase QueC [candidate division WOR-1 bacterium RIFOXYD2_FULL_41_8]
MLKKPKAIILFSGGLDSATTLYYVLSKGYDCHALIFDYGQRHNKEIRSAVAMAKSVKVPYQIIKIKLPWKGSVLLDKKIKVPKYKKSRKGIPPTYVPARNTIFLSFATSYAEAVGAQTILYGANAIDYSGYPDCRPAFVKAFQNVIKAGTKNNKIKVRAPLIKLTKAQIIKLAMELKVPLDKTWSCYEGGKKPCGVCDSCRLREKGYSALNLSDL